MGSGGSGQGAAGVRPHKKLRFLETFLRYFGERMGSGGKRLGCKKKCLQLYSIGRYIILKNGTNFSNIQELTFKVRLIN